MRRASLRTDPRRLCSDCDNYVFAHGMPCPSWKMVDGAWLVSYYMEGTQKETVSEKDQILNLIDWHYILGCPNVKLSMHHGEVLDDLHQHIDDGDHKILPTAQGIAQGRSVEAAKKLLDEGMRILRRDT